MKGDPGCSASVPVADTVNSDTLPLPASPPAVLIAKRKLPTASKVKNTGALFGAKVVAKEARVPVLVIENDVISRVFGLEVYRNDPLGEMARPISPVVFSDTGNPDSGESAPVAVSKEKPNIWAGVLLRAYTNFPFGWITSLITLLPVGNGEPATGVSAAVELFSVKDEMLADAAFATRTNFLFASTAKESGEEAPVLTGDADVF